MRLFCFLTGALTALLLASAPALAQDKDGIVCRGSADCQSKWARAHQWVLDNSKFPITTDTPTEISTVQRTGFGDLNLIVTVSMFARRNGTSLITLRAGCGALFSPCRPRLEVAQASFNRYVASASPLPAPRPPAAGAAALPLAPRGAAPAGAPAEENILYCHGGGEMTLHVQLNASFDRNIHFVIGFRGARHGVRQGALAPGECAFLDRGLAADEPSTIELTGAQADIDLTLTQERHVASYALKGTSRFHDVAGAVLNGFFNATDFTVPVAASTTLAFRGAD